ncbi:hypothetical protein NYO99_14730 [Pelomonas sp. UHG3]|jgi:hypothetical protein|uniref:Uncharacterized protein n=1 Tax=Roseateles hydrophilus TaxID=2975054 RepID=A0ACC6CD81_9BURK|nr:hypothetical protein [Pelomonas sp. UHG3]MCY4746240.1 hypothetical protein [Pelomonas sp. UHG3]
MTKMFLAGLAALLLAASAQAQPAPPVCQVQQPQVPPTEWRGQAAYRAKAEVRNGRVTRMEITSLTGGVDRRTQRALVEAIGQALRGARCQPGDHVFEQRFDFDVRSEGPAGQQPTTLAAEDAKPLRQGEQPIVVPPVPAWKPVLTPDACEVPSPALPAAAASSAWRGQATYRSQADVRDGRLLAVRTRAVTAPKDPVLNSALFRAVSDAMRAARCPADTQLVERNFDFDLSGDAPR